MKRNINLELDLLHDSSNFLQSADSCRDERDVTGAAVNLQNAVRCIVKAALTPVIQESYGYLGVDNIDDLRALCVKRHVLAADLERILDIAQSYIGEDTIYLVPEWREVVEVLQKIEDSVKARAVAALQAKGYSKGPHESTRDFLKKHEDELDYIK